VGDVINAPDAVIYTPGEGEQVVEGLNETAADTIWLQPSTGFLCTRGEACYDNSMWNPGGEILPEW
jgi:hypothetical protein